VSDTDESVIVSADGSEVRYRDLAGCPGYRVGSDGSIWSCRITGRNSRTVQLCDRWRLLNVYRRPYGSRYCVVCLRPEPNGRVRQFYVHQLVLEAFVGPRPLGTEACHNDGDTANNALINLRWDTSGENKRDEYRHGRRRHRLSPDDLALAVRMRQEGATFNAIALHFGVNPSTVTRSLRRAALI
jgi:HNH endonuclease/Helix-turn-helix domain